MVRSWTHRPAEIQLQELIKVRHHYNYRLQCGRPVAPDPQVAVTGIRRRPVIQDSPFLNALGGPILRCPATQATGLFENCLVCRIRRSEVCSEPLREPENCAAPLSERAFDYTSCCSESPKGVSNHACSTGLPGKIRHRKQPLPMHTTPRKRRRRLQCGRPVAPAPQVAVTGIRRRPVIQDSPL